MSPSTSEFSAIIALFAALISAGSALIALFAVLMNRKNWRDSNRPIVTVFIDEKSSTEGLTIFNLHLLNSGTRPATGVQLHASKASIQKILSNQAEESRRKHIEGVFTAESRVAVLHAGDTLETSFGIASTDPDQQWLNYGEELEVEVSYRDLEDRSYKSTIPLKVRPREGFGGGIWRTAA